MGYPAPPLWKIGTMKLYYASSSEILENLYLKRRNVCLNDFSCVLKILSWCDNALHLKGMRELYQTPAGLALKAYFILMAGYKRIGFLLIKQATCL